MEEMAMYTTEYAEKSEVGYGLNGNGRRVKSLRYYVINPHGQRIYLSQFSARAKADLPRAKKAAEDWAQHLNEKHAKGLL